MAGTGLTPERWRTTEEILLAVWDAPAEAREGLLLERCAGDSELLDYLRELMAAQLAADQWTAPGAALSSDGVAPAGTARRVGPFEIERMIGRGGMGAVYLAHRADGQFEQKVAVKLIGLPFELEAFRQSFRRERQILAGLDHPHITRLLDGGVTTDGDLYLAMEYVDGIAIDVYCRRPGHTVEESLRLFQQVCSAVQYSHQNLIVHRDIKPSNILVTSTGNAKLLDFGTATLVAGADTTQTGTGLMTVAYASPEQLRGEAVSTLSDVYSLGAVLFEMLAGRKAFDGGLGARLADERPPLLPESLGGELQQILQKALAPAPAQRYASVEQLSEDVRRYLDGEPVLAHPPGLWYRTAKFVRRNRLAVAGAALLVVTLAGGVAATLWQARLTRAAQLRAERRFNDVRQLAHYLVFDIHSGLERLPGSTTLEKQVVERSLRYLDALAAENASDPALRLEMAEAYQKLGDVLGNPFTNSIGDRKAALAIYPKALALANSVAAQEPRNARARQLVASIELHYGGTQYFGGDREAGKAMVARAVEQLKGLLAEAPKDADLLLAVANGLTFQAARMQDGGGFTDETHAAECEKLYDQASAYINTALAQNPGDVRCLRQLAQNEWNSAFLWGSVNPLRSIQHSQSALQAIDRIPADEQGNVEVRRLRGNILKNIGWAHGQLSQFKEALANTDQAGEILHSLLSADPSNTSAMYQVSAIHRNRGIIRNYAKDSRGAIEDFEVAAGLLAELSRRDAANTNYQVVRADLLGRIGTMEHNLGREAVAIQKVGEAQQIMKRLADAPKAPPIQLMTACSWLTETVVVSLRDPKTALPYCQRGVELTEGKDMEAWNRLAVAQYALKDYKAAVRSMEKVMSMMPANVAGQPKSRQRQTTEDLLVQYRKAAGH